MAPRSVPGVFLGYHLQPGGKWKGDVVVASLADFRATAEDPNHSVHIQRVREVTLDDPHSFTFPFKEAHERRRADVPPLLADSPHVIDDDSQNVVADGGTSSGEPTSDGWDVPPVLEPVPLPAPAPQAPEVPPGPALPDGCVKVPGGYMLHGQFWKPYKNTPRPPWIIPEQWTRYTRKQKDEIFMDWEKLRKEIEAYDRSLSSAADGTGGSSSSSSSSGAVPCLPQCVVPSMPHQESMLDSAD